MSRAVPAEWVNVGESVEREVCALAADGWSNQDVIRLVVDTACHRLSQALVAALSALPDVEP